MNEEQMEYERAQHLVYEADCGLDFAVSVLGAINVFARIVSLVGEPEALRLIANRLDIAANRARF